jgi:hypothetical protein
MYESPHITTPQSIYKRYEIRYPVFFWCLLESNL